MEQKNMMVVFQGNNIRKSWFNEEWYYSIIDVVKALETSSIPKRYWSDLKKTLLQEGFEPYDKIVQLKLLAEDGKLRVTDCINTKNMLRIVQSIPSKKAEPFKLWLAKVGHERIQEIENPELAYERMKETYSKKGYSHEWIEKRVRGKIIRDELTDEWKQRGVKEKKDFAILTNEISKATFDKTVGEYIHHKGLTKQHLRDHMDDIELILTMLGEASTTKFTKVRDSQQFPELKDDAKDGGEVAGVAKKNLEKKLGKTVVSKENYLDIPEKDKRKKLNSSNSRGLENEYTRTNN
jgi:DNA-damage-inducible protein D